MYAHGRGVGDGALWPRSVQCGRVPLYRYGKHAARVGTQSPQSSNRTRQRGTASRHIHRFR